jgi:hypothetical protein
MFHVVLSFATRFLYLGNVLHGFAREILALRNLPLISSHLIPALSPPPPVAFLDAPTAFVELSNQIVSPLVSVVSAVSDASADIIAIECQSPVFSSPIASYQSSLMLVTPSQLPDLVSILIFLAIISGFLIIIPEIVYFFMKIAKIPSAFTLISRFFAKIFRTNPITYLVPNYVPSGSVPSQFLLSLISLLYLRSGPVGTIE